MHYGLTIQRNFMQLHVEATSASRRAIKNLHGHTMHCAEYLGQSRKTIYFPMQNSEKILSRMSSVVIMPVISPNVSATTRKSMASNSQARPFRTDSEA